MWKQDKQSLSKQKHSTIKSEIDLPKNKTINKI